MTYTEELERTSGGIYMFLIRQEKNHSAEPLKPAGPDVKNLKVGDQVLFDKYSGTKIKIENDDCLIIREEDILGVFED